MAGRKVVKFRISEQFARAMKDITESNMSISAAARKHGIPRVTLSD